LDWPTISLAQPSSINVFEVANYEKDWRECLQADRVETAKSTQRLQESTKATKDIHKKQSWVV
jgi:hypothetical protein